MTQPPAYVPAINFYATYSKPEDANLDTEFSHIKATTDGVRTNLALIQRDDGALANNSVGYDQLAVSLTLGINIVTTWVTGHAYVVNDGVWHSTALYICRVAHTSGVFATDLAALDWTLVVDFSVPSAADAAAAAVSATAAATSATASATSATASAASAAAAAASAGAITPAFSYAVAASASRIGNL